MDGGLDSEKHPLNKGRRVEGDKRRERRECGAKTKPGEERRRASHYTFSCKTPRKTRRVSFPFSPLFF